MVVSSLYNQVAQLGFEASLESDSRFYFAANRALIQVNELRPMMGICVVNHKVLNPVTVGSFEPTVKTGDIVYEASSAKSYYFEVDGNGRANIEGMDSSGTWTPIGVIDFNSPTKAFIAYKGVIKKDGKPFSGAVRITFTGDYVYSVRSVALYDHLYSDDDNDVPSYEEHVRYNISTMVDDFIAFAEPPIKDGFIRLYEDYDVENGRALVLPRDKTGVYKVEYRRRPKMIDDSYMASTNGDTIDLDEDLCVLLPTLVASYVLLEDEPEMAGHYLNMYREMAAMVVAKARNASPVKYVNESGW
jgi:hypothetical protein